MSDRGVGKLEPRGEKVSVRDLDRANKFYGETLGWPPAYEGKEQVGYLLDQIILMLKANWDMPPTATPNPRVTIETESATSRRGHICSL